MGQARNWTPKELADMQNFVRVGWSDKEISDRLNRTVSAVHQKRVERIGSYIICKDCGTSVKVKRGKRLRCVACADKHNIEVKQLRGAEWYQRNMENRKSLRSELRFGGNREAAIQRDGEKCQSCGMSRAEHLERFNTDITVDHVDGSGRNSKEQNNALENLRTMCLPCHGKKDVARRRKDWSMCAASLKRYWKEKRETSPLERWLKG